jgi:hypothetical protein
MAKLKPQSILKFSKSAYLLKTFATMPETTSIIIYNTDESGNEESDDWVGGKAESQHTEREDKQPEGFRKMLQ